MRPRVFASLVAFSYARGYPSVDFLRYPKARPSVLRRARKIFSDALVDRRLAEADEAYYVGKSDKGGAALV